MSIPHNHKPTRREQRRNQRQQCPQGAGSTKGPPRVDDGIQRDARYHYRLRCNKRLLRSLCTDGMLATLKGIHMPRITSTYRSETHQLPFQTQTLRTHSSRGRARRKSKDDILPVDRIRPDITTNDSLQQHIVSPRAAKGHTRNLLPRTPGSYKALKKRLLNQRTRSGSPSDLNCHLPSIHAQTRRSILRQNLWTLKTNQ